MAFPQVINACASVQRPGGQGTWIVPEMIHAYTKLHYLGYAHSVETWKDGELAGGLYGIAMGRAFFGESMFYYFTDASKVALVKLVQFLSSCGFEFIDCQQTTAHMMRFGAFEISRKEFVRRLNLVLQEDILNIQSIWAPANID